MGESFKLGDKVAIVTRNAVAPDMYRVSRVLKRFIETDDGSRWTHSGQPYPRQPYSRVDWPPQHIEHWTERHTRARKIVDAIRIARNIVERLKEANVAEARCLARELEELLAKVEE